MVVKLCTKPSEKDSSRGILNDSGWDLDFPSSCTPPYITEPERTGSVPLMPLDVLTDIYWKGLTVRRYCHCLEGLVWVLVWVFGHYEDGRQEFRDLHNWMTDDYAACRTQKIAFLEKYSRFSASDSFAPEEPLMTALLEWVFDRWFHRSKVAYRHRLSDKSDEEVYCQFWRVVQGVVDEQPDLDASTSQS